MIKPKPKIKLYCPTSNTMRFECSGPHPKHGDTAYGYGRTMRMAYHLWHLHALTY